MEALRNFPLEKTKENLAILIQLGEGLKTAIEKRLGNGTQELETKPGVELSATDHTQDSVANLITPIINRLEIAGMLSAGVSEDDKQFFIGMATQLKGGIEDEKLSSIITQVEERSREYLK